MNAVTNSLSSSLRAPVIVSGRSTSLNPDIRVNAELAVYYPTGSACRVGNIVYLLDGVGIAGTSAIVDSQGVAKFFGSRINSDSVQDIANRWGQDIKNPCAAFVVDLDAQFALCLPDPLGGALAFRYRAHSVEVVSTDIVSLTLTVAAMRLPIEKSADYQLERLILGNGGLTHSSYMNVERLNPFEYWEIRSSGTKAKGYRRAVHDYSYLESVQLIRNELIESVEAISKVSSDRKIAHVTGGFDSRLVLAASMAAGCAKDFTYFCSGPEGSTDRKIADGLSLTFDLPRCSGGGLTAAPVSGVHQQLLGPLYHSGGITSSGPNGGEVPADVTVIGGGYGEVLRSFYSSRFRSLAPVDVNPLSLLEVLVPKGSKAPRIYTDSALNSLASRLYLEWQRLKDLGYPHDAIGDGLYTSVRNRYHIGQNSMLWSRVGHRFDPLYSVTAESAAKQLPLYSREANVLGFDIMESFGLKIEGYPFDKNRFSENYQNIRRIPSPQKFKTATLNKFDDTYHPKFKDSIQLPRQLDRLAVAIPKMDSLERKATVAEANRIGLNFWHVATLPSAQKSLQLGLKEFGLNAIDGLVDKAYVNHLSQDNLTQRSEIRDVYSLYGLVAWLGIDG